MASWWCFLPLPALAKESFFYRESKLVFDLIEETSHRSGVSRGAAFEDFLHVVTCTLGHPLMEQEYLETIEKHKSGRHGKRGVDSLAKGFAELVEAMEKTRADILGDIFQGSITYGERGQFLTPESITRMMAQMSLPPEPTGLDGRRSVCDPACGSGRTLLAAADMQPHWHFVGQDSDLRCTRMCAINLALRNAYGHAVWGNSLRNEANLIYETGRVQVWGNAIRKVNRVPLPDREPEEIDLPASEPPTSDNAIGNSHRPHDDHPVNRSQLRLF